MTSTRKIKENKTKEFKNIWHIFKYVIYNIQTESLLKTNVPLSIRNYFFLGFFFPSGPQGIVLIIL